MLTRNSANFIDFLFSCQSGDFERFSDLQWDLFIRQAKASNLLARIGDYMLNHSVQAKVLSPKIYRHFVSETYVAAAVQRSAKREAALIYQALQSINTPVILLKGAAYAVAGLQAGKGRLFLDTDILVSKVSLEAIDKMLMWYGWVDQTENQYDQKYYRKWMHELPPKFHSKRGSALDVHHNILPLTCSICPDAEKLIAAAVKIPDTNYFMLAPTDMLLHSSCHLFWGGEFENGLRDLSDMDLLLREFSEQDVDFQQKLVIRAQELGLGMPLFYALRYTVSVLNCPVELTIIEQSAQFSPGSSRTKVMDFLFLRALMPHHSSCDGRWSGLARWLLYVRSHWLRMPWYLLVPHLLRKSWRRLLSKDAH